MGSGGSSSEGDSSTTLRYADYVETAHKTFLLESKSYGDLAIADNPYNDFTEIPVDEGFFGAGYTLASFPSLYDMYGKFVAGLDIDALWSQSFESTVNGPEAGNLVSAESEFLQDELDSTVLPRYMTGMRDMNAVMSSSFIIGKGQLEDTRQKAVAKFSADLKYKLVGLAQDKWKTHLNWNTEVAASYMNLLKHYFTIREGVETFNLSTFSSKAKWPMEILDYERANLGALQGATKSKTEGAEASTTSKVLGGALSGAAMGATVGGGWGAAVGGVVGGIAGAFL